MLVQTKMYIRDGPVNLVGGGGGGGGQLKNDFWAIFFCCYYGSANLFFLGMCRANFFYSNFFSEGEGRGGG